MRSFSLGSSGSWGVTSVTSWAKLIMLSCHDEQAGFERFFQLLDEFKQRSVTGVRLESDV